MGEDEGTTVTRRARLRAWLDSEVQKDAISALREARDAQRALSEEIAERIRKPINEHLRSQPHSSYAEKVSMMRWLNSELRSLHLGVACPKSGLPGILIGDHGRDATRGRFRLRVNERDGSPRVTITSVELPEFRFSRRDFGRE